MIDLSGDGVRAVLIGVGKHTEHSILPEVPASSRTVAALGDCLVESCGLAKSNLRAVVDPERPEHILDAILDAAASARDVLLVYYVGHGVLDPDGALYLATGATRDLTMGKAAYQALPFEQIGKELRHHRRIRATIVILDCCYSARAAPPVPDCFLIASADRDESAVAEPGAPYPAFSGQLIRILREGDPLGPPQLTVSAAYRCLAWALAAQDRPVPRVYFGGDVGDLVLTTNNAYRERAGHDDGPDRQVPEERDDACPYRGLASYDTADTRWFRGRDALTETIVRALADRVWHGGPLVVLGASGSGKSSLLRAGLLPALRRGDLGVPGSAAWPAVVFTPGAQPMRAFVEALREFGAPGPADVRPALTVNDRLIVVVDQFEELFTLCTDEVERKDFVSALWALTTDNPVVLVVLGLRSDFYGACTAYPEMVGSLERTPIVVGPMTTRELRSAIDEPAELAGLLSQDGLTEIVLRDLGVDPADDDAAGYDPGVLPFLSFALQETWLRRRRRMLTVEGYRSTGGIELAVATAADATYTSLDPPARTAARHLLLHLVAASDSVADIRRTVERAGVIADCPDATGAEAALRAFVTARLLTLRGNTVEITHEAVIRGWPRLHGWIATERTGNQVRQRIAADAEEWLKADRDPTHLYPGSRLAAAQEHVDDDSALGPAGREFLGAAVRQRRRVQQRRRVFQVILAMLTLVAVVAAGIAIQQRSTAVARGVVATQQRDAALSRQLAAESVDLRANQPNLAKQLALAGHAISPTTDATSAIYDVLATPGVIDLPAPTNDVAFSPNGRLLAIAAGNDVRLWSLAGHTVAAVLTGHTSRVSGVVFNHAGDIVASVSEDQTVRLWRVTGPNPNRQLATLPGPLSSIAFSHDDRTLVAGGYDGTVPRWDVRDPGHPMALPALAGHTGAVLAVAISPDGQLLASGSTDRTVRLSRMDGTAVAILTGHTDVVADVAFAPSGHVLASVGADNTVRLWDITVPERPVSVATLPVTTGGGDKDSVAFAPNSDVLACACDVPRIWDVTDPRHPSELPPLAPNRAVPSGGTSTVAALRFSPDSSILAGAETGGTVDLWPASDLRHPSALAALPGQTLDIADMAYAPRRHLLAIVTIDPISRDVLLVVWDLGRPGQIRRLAGFPGSGVNGLAFRPDGRVLAVTRNGAVELWDMTDPARPVTDATVGQQGSGAIVQAAAFSADGTLLATGWGVYDVRLWLVADPHHPVGGHVFSYEDYFAFSPTAPLLVVGGLFTAPVQVWNVRNQDRPTHITTLSGPSDLVSDLAFSPDGRTVAGEYTTATELWDIGDPSHPRTLSTLAGYVGGDAVAFGPDGDTLATGEQSPSPGGTPSGTTHLWDITDPRHPAVYATIDSGPVMTFGPAGEFITAGYGTTVDIWPATTNLAIRLACRNSGTDITPAQWQRYLPDGEPYRPPCH